MSLKWELPEVEGVVMKGKGHVDDGSGSSLGSTSAGDTVWDPEALYRAMLARSGLSMLAGTGFHGRSSLTGNLGLRFGKPPLHGNGNGIGGSSSAPVVEQQPQVVQPLSPDVIRRLSMDECWRLILELGKSIIPTCDWYPQISC